MAKTTHRITSLWNVENQVRVKLLPTVMIHSVPRIKLQFYTTYVYF